jgi:LAO/AO transport system kinase
LVDVIAVNKADGGTRIAAELAARQYDMALRSLIGRHENVPPVLTCSALQHEHIDSVWNAVERRYANIKANGELAERHRRQGVRWLWAIIEDRLRQAVRDHPDVRAIRDGLEAGVLAGTMPPEVAARNILEAFGLADRRPKES